MVALDSTCLHLIFDVVHVAKKAWEPQPTTSFLGRSRAPHAYDAAAFANGVAWPDTVMLRIRTEARIKGARA